MAPVDTPDVLGCASYVSFSNRSPWLVPAVFAVSWLAAGNGLVHSFQHLLAGMWLHEAGHAVSSWLTGRFAVPVPWFTWTFDHSWLMSLAVFGAGLALAWRPRWRVAGCLLLVSAAFAHLLSDRSEEVFIVFSGDAGAMVFGAAMASLFFVRAETPVTRNGLRWGWLAIGANAWASASRHWFSCWRDPSEILYGLENDTPSDPSKLVDTFDWDEASMIRRFLLVAVVTGLAVLAVAFMASRQPQKSASHF